jgi:enoyl-CoA hydratase/carnithine racemase
MTGKIKVATRGKVRVITLNRPEVRNAFDEELLEALASAIIDADHDDSVAVIAVTGAGTAFSSGDDLRNAREKS